MPSIHEDHGKFCSLIQGEIHELEEWLTEEELMNNKLYRCYYCCTFFAECYPGEDVRQRYLEILEEAERDKEEFLATDDEALRRAFFLEPKEEREDWRSDID